MKDDQRVIRRKLRILNHAQEIGSVVQTCRHFDIGRATFYRLRTAYRDHGEAGLIDKPPVPRWHANRTAPEVEEKVVFPRKTYHLGPIRISWYMARYHKI